MKQFDEWYSYVESEGKLWPTLGRYDTEDELIAAKEAWTAALEWVDTVIESAMVTPSVWFLQVQISLDIEKELNVNTKKRC